MCRGGKKVFIICQSVDACEQAGEAKLAFKAKDELGKKKDVYFNDSEKVV